MTTRSIITTQGRAGPPTRRSGSRHRTVPHNPDPALTRAVPRKPGRLTNGTGPFVTRRYAWRLGFGLTRFLPAESVHAHCACSFMNSFRHRRWAPALPTGWPARGCVRYANDGGSATSRWLRPATSTDAASHVDLVNSLNGIAGWIALWCRPSPPGVMSLRYKPGERCTRPLVGPCLSTPAGVALAANVGGFSRCDPGRLYLPVNTG
jgi:hypothetical protein